MVNNQLNTNLDKKGKTNWTRCQILRYLTDMSECTQTSLQRAINIDHAAITRHLQILEVNGDIFRKRNPDNLRENIIQITEQSLSTYNSYSISHMDLYEEIFKELDSKMLVTLLDNLKKLDNNLESI
uniref:MarR family winged helix-turn-helix transcriptional regulator n=1 Tax=Paenibacillus sp. FSL H8-0079 TaxID=2921375 RepID=UPI00403F03D4